MANPSWYRISQRVSFDHPARCMCHISIFFSSIQMTPLDWIRQQPPQIRSTKGRLPF
jgi:hypothetical protein